MKWIKKLSIVLVGLLITSNVFAQDDTKIVIKTDKGEMELEEYMENIGDNLGDLIGNWADNFDIDIDIDIDDEDMDVDIDIDIPDFEDGIEEWAENLEKMVNNMEIEVTDLDPSEFNDNKYHHNNRSGRDFLQEIEDEFGSEVKHIDKMNIKIKEGIVDIDMKVQLENGKTVRKSFKDVGDDD